MTPAAHPAPAVVASVQAQQSGRVFPQRRRLLSGVGQLVPAHVEPSELSQPPQPLQGRHVVEACVQELEAGLREEQVSLRTVWYALASKCVYCTM